MKGKSIVYFLLIGIVGANCIESQPIYAIETIHDEQLKSETYDGEGYIIQRNVNGIWENEFINDIIITNTTAQIIDKWALQFEFAGEIKDIWNAQITSCDKGTYTIEPCEWNKEIEENGNIQLGFIGRGEDTTIEPTNFRLKEVNEINNEITTIQLDKTYTNNLIEEEKWYSFVPEETGSYELTIEGNGALKNKIYDTIQIVDDELIKEVDKLAGTLLQEKEYYFKVVSTNKTSNTYAINIKKIQEPTNTLFEKQWGLLNEENGIDINILPVWQYTKGKNAIVGVADTGIDYAHPNLIEGINLDLSYNFVHDIEDTFPNSELYNSMAAAGGHGTLVGGIINASVEHENKGTIGVAPECDVASLKIIGNKIEGHTVYKNSIEAFAKAVEYAQVNNIRIINCSFGGSVPSVVEKEVMLAAKDILFVISAGNSGVDLSETPNYPACYYHDNSLVVAAIDRAGDLVSFSNYGGPTEIVAPGEEVMGTFPYGEYGEGTGTSMAAPFVSAVAGLILSLNNDLTPIELKNQIIGNATKLDNIEDGRLLNAYKAVITPEKQEKSEVYLSRQVLGINKKQTIDYYKDKIKNEEKTNEVIVKIKENKKIDEVIESAIKEAGIDNIGIEDYINLIGSYVIKCETIEDAEQIITLLNSYDSVVYAEMNYIRKL